MLRYLQQRTWLPGAQELVARTRLDDLRQQPHQLADTDDLINLDRRADPFSVTSIGLLSTIVCLRTVETLRLTSSPMLSLTVVLTARRSAKTSAVLSVTVLAALRTSVTF